MNGNRFLIRFNNMKERFEIIDTWFNNTVKVTMDYVDAVKEFSDKRMVDQCFYLNMEHDERYHYLCEVQNWLNKQLIKKKNLYHPMFNVHML